MKAPPIERDWEGRLAIVVATGPSVSLTPLHLIRNIPTIVVNDSWRLFPHADILYAADKRWWEYHEFVPEFRGKRIAPIRGNERWALDAKLNVVNIDTGGTGFSFDPIKIHGGYNSGFQALNIAILKGASIILLLGFDMTCVGNKRHWFGDHPAKLNRDSPYHLFLKGFEEAAKQLQSRCSPIIINCSSSSKLSCFEKMSLTEALDAYSAYLTTPVTTLSS